MKKLISALLALAMILSLMPLSVFATEEEETPVRNPIVALYVGNVNALETPQGDGWSFDAGSGVLTLNNCTLTESMLHVETDEYGSNRYDAMIYVKGDLTIELIGNNSVERVIEEAPTDYTNYYAICNSIYCPSDWEMPGSLTFVGDGNLTVGIAVTRDYLSEDGYSTNEAWEYLEFSSGIGSWNYTDLSGLYGGGWMDIYGGVYGVEAPYIACAFANYPTFGDNCIVTAYQDVEGTIENENGYNWNNNDAWRMKVVTGNAILKDNGQLILMEADSASGDGWTWADKVLTLSEGTEVTAVDFRSGLGSAKLVLTGDVTLDGTDLGIDSDWNDLSAIETHCDLEIDAGAHTLTFTGYTGGIKSYLSDVLISGGTVADNGEGYIEVKGANLTVQDATLRLGYGINLSSGYDADYNDVPAGNLLIQDTVLAMEAGVSSDGGLTIMGSEVTVTDVYGNEFVALQDSTVTVNSYGLAVNTGGRVTVDNCNLDIYGEGGAIGYTYYHYTWDEEGIIPDASWIQLLNMDITQPEGCTVRVSEEADEYYTKYAVQVVDGDGNVATTLKATAAGADEHEHSYTNGVCSCGAKQTFTVTWYNWDGTVLEVDTVQYGETPEYNGPTPTRTGEGYDYTFYAWGYNESGSQTGTPGPATANQHWHAKFTSVAHKHYLIFMDSDGVTELGRFERSYNQSIIITTANLFTWAGQPTKDCYTLSGWYRADGLTNSNFYMPDHDVVFVAIWDGPDHTWVEADCDTPKTCSVCGETEGEALGHSYTEGVCACGKKQTFTITWKNDDGTILEVDTVEYGDHPEYNGPTPTKTGEGYEYTFYAWSNGTQYTNVEQVTVTRDWTYTAGYNKIAHKHDLIFMDGDVELARQEVNYNSSLSSYTLNSYAGNPAKDCYTLSGWAYADGTQLTSNVYLNMPDEDVVLYAVWDGPNHTWVDATCEAPKTCSVCGETEGEALGHSWVEATCEAPKTCSGCGLTEGEALSDHNYVDGVCSCGKIQTFTITWVNWDGTVLETDTVEYGITPEYNGSTPTKEVTGQTCTFAGWGTVNAATADKTYTATFYQTANKYNVILMDGDTELGRHELAYDAIVSESRLPEYAGNPTKPCCTIAGWQYADGTVFSSTRMTAEDMVLYIVWDGPNHTWVDATCEAPKTCSVCGETEGEALEHTYTEGVCSCGAKQTFTITWVNWDGTVLETDTVEYGTVPTYDGATPTRPNVGYDFNFYGWALSASGAETTIGAATQDRTYYAKYTSSIHYHDIIFMAEDMVTELGRYETYYDKLIATSWLTTASGITVPPCYTAWWRYEDGSMPEESFRMPDHDVVLYLMMEGPGHVYDGVITTEPTCTEYGVMTYTCIGCGDSYTDSLWPKGHSYQGVVTEPTCTEGGYTTYTCSDCGDSYVGDQVAAHGHDYCNYVTTEPTCTTDGYTTYSCMFCGDSYVTDIVEGGHKYVLKEYTPATCTKYGTVTNVCTVCGDEVTDEDYLVPLGHDYVAVVTTEPTCTKAGVMTYTCSRCDDSYTEEIAILPHDFSSDAVCNDCGLEAGASVTIGDTVTYYSTAVEAAWAIRGRTEDGILVKMLKDLTVSQEFYEDAVWFYGCKCTFDLNGMTLKGRGNFDAPLTIDKGAYVTVIDSVGTGSIITTKEMAHCIEVNPGNSTDADTPSTAIINSGTFTAVNRALDSGNLATTIINGGTFHGDSVGVFSAFYDGTLIINGGTITGDRAISSYAWSNNTIIINGGTISGTTLDFYGGSEDSLFILSAGEDGIGATFPGGITFGGTSDGIRPLNALLGEGMTYWCNGSAISFNDDVYEFSGGDVSVRKICQHSYENGYCTECGQKDPNYVEVVVPTLTLKYPTLAFEDEILYNAYFTVSDATSIVEMGMITFDSRLADGTIADAVEVIPGYYTVGSNYIVSSNGIPAKNLGDALYFKVYAKLTDGSYAYSDVAGYNAVAYANTILNNASSTAKAKALVVAMLNYGAAAQTYFNYNADKLMNASLTAEQLALVDAYDESMVDAVVKADSSKVGLFVHNGGYTRVFPTVSFEGAFSINYYFATKYTPDTAPTFYIWDAETYNSVEVLTAENAVGTIDMVLDGDQWVGTVAGIAAKEIDQTYYTAGVYYVGDTAYYSPVVSYSLGNYCETLAASDNAFGAATAVYGYYAKAYFN